MGSLKATVSGNLLSRKQVRVVPLRPGPVSTMFRSLASGTLGAPKREVSLLSMRRMIAYSLPGFQRVELAHHWGGDLLDDLRLFGGEILAPTTRARLTVELALPFHVLGDGLPGVLLDRPRQLVGVHLYPEGGVQAPHGSEGVGPQVFVEDHRPWALVGVVCAPGILHVAKVLLGRSARHGLGALVGEAPDPRAAAHFCQLSLLVASSEEATTSLGSRTSRIIRLSGSASIRNGAPTPPPGSLTTR